MDAAYSTPCLSEEDGDVDVIPMEMDLTANGPPPPDDDVSERKASKDTCGTKMKRFATRVLPHVGLVILLGVYTVCGAGIFHVLELPNELKVRKNTLETIKNETTFLLDLLWNMSMDDGMTKERWIIYANSNLTRLKTEIYEAYDNQYVTNEDLKIEYDSNFTTRAIVWTIPQSIFFATTVITTIGYGNMVPKTPGGKIFCIVYGLFGIPLLLITIADIGKFLSDLMKYLHQSYRRCKRQLQKQSRRFSTFRRKSLGLPPAAQKKKKDDKEMRLPWIMVMLVLITYMALGALLFHYWETWEYFDAFYFCFITMSTVGFGDIVPREQAYMFFTIAYILIGLALTTMCIDLAGTEYIEKIHYFGQKIETAKGVVGGAMVSGLHAGQDLLKHTGYGFIRTAGGKIVQVSDNVLLSVKQANALRQKYNLPEDYNFGGMVIPEGMSESQFLATHPELMSRRRHGLMDPLHHNILFAPISPEVQKLLKPHIKLRPEEIKESDAFILENKTFNKPLDEMYQSGTLRSREEIKHRLRSQTWPRKLTSENVLLVAPFLLKESNC